MDGSRLGATWSYDRGVFEGEKESMRATGIGPKQEERTCMVVGALEGILKW
jgi:hypothetical protein